MKFYCPSCRSKLIIRSSRNMSLTTREIRVYCSNIDTCGASYSYLLALDKTLTPPRKDITQMAIEIINFLPKSERKLAVMQINQEDSY